MEAKPSPRAKSTGRRLLRREERQAAILKGAAAAFARSGFAATSMDDVAAECGVSRLILYRHFEGKEELYRAVLQQVFDRQAEELVRSLEAGNVRGLGFRTLLTVAREHPEGFTLLWRHAAREPQFADYASEKASENEIWFTFGWPYETTACVTRLIFSGLYDELPGLKIITHHYCGMVPFYAGKIQLGFDQIFFGTSQKNPQAEKAGLRRAPMDYYKMIYADTALNGSVAATRCGHAFFGAEHSVFATDAPFDAEDGRLLIRTTLAAIDALEIPRSEKDLILGGNARRLLKLQ